jgi:hypothetical protein
VAFTGEDRTETEKPPMRDAINPLRERKPFFPTIERDECCGGDDVGGVSGTKARTCKADSCRSNMIK